MQLFQNQLDFETDIQGKRKSQKSKGFIKEDSFEDKGDFQHMFNLIFSAYDDKM